MRSRLLAFALAITAPVVILLIFGAMPILRGPAYKTAWQAGGSAEVPRKFFYLLFPKTEHVELLNSNGIPTGKYLSRALMCSEAELKGKLVGVWDGNDELKIPVSELAFTREAPARDRLISEWKKAVKSWRKETDWPRVEASFEQTDSKTVRVFLRLTNRRGVPTIFIYSVKDGKAQAEKIQVNRVKALAS